MKTCQACGLPNINERRTCKRCGASLDDAPLNGARSPEVEWYVILAGLAPLVAVVAGWFLFFALGISMMGEGPDQSGRITNGLSEQAELSIRLRMSILPWLPAWVVAIVSIPIVWRSARRGSLLVLIGMALFVATVEAVILMQSWVWAGVSQAISGAVQGLP